MKGAASRGSTASETPLDYATSGTSGAVRTQEAVARALAFLRDTQHNGDHWVGILSSSALATAMSIVALHLADSGRYAEQVRRGRAWLLTTQASDGGWGDAVEDPSNINATSLAFAALTFTVPQRLEPGMSEALAGAVTRLEGLGGWGSVGDPALCTLSGPCRTVAALAGLMDRNHIKHLRPEAIFLPAPLRRSISTTYPAYLAIAMMHSAMADHPLNRLPTYQVACRRAVAWLASAQGPNGSFEESAFLTSVIIMGLIASGQSEPTWLRQAIQYVAESQRADGSWPIDRDLETFDTDMAVQTFAEAGTSVPQPSRVRDWLLDRQFSQPCYPTGAEPGGWAWSMPAGWPDSDDTSYTVLALRRLGVPTSAETIKRGADWLMRMQNTDGSWSTFVRNSSMPFDHACPYITGHVVSALRAAGTLREYPLVLERALAYLSHAQRYDGSFGSIWFREATAGTASVLEALADCRLTETPMAERARDALLRNQNDDGGWAGVRLQNSTAEETAWAVLALLRCSSPEFTREAVRRGVSWLLDHQRPDGTWKQAPIGLYYSAMWYSDSLYAVNLPAQALARAQGLYASHQ